MNIKIFDDIVDWCRNTFQHPIVFVCMTAGVLLIVYGLGVMDSFMPIEKSNSSQPRLAPLVAGGLFTILAIFLTYNPPKAWTAFRQKKSVRQNEMASIESNSGIEPGQRKISSDVIDTPEAGSADEPSDYEKSLNERKQSLSKRQNQLLEIIEQHNTKIFIPQIEETFKSVEYKELYYRLEQLRLLGFINKERIGSEHVYCLSDAYQLIFTRNCPDRTILSP